MKLSIKGQLEKNSITRYKLAKMIGITYPTIDNMYKETTSSISFTILESLCRALDCNLDDILIFDDPDLRAKQLKHNSYNSSDNDSVDTQ